MDQTHQLMRWTAWIFLTATSVISFSAHALALYPRSELVNSSSQEEIVHRRVILGSLKKIQNELQPEAFVMVNSSRSSNTYYLDGERSVERVIDFYRAEIASYGDILFECIGRDCGSSAFWANTVFEQSILYGPEQFQAYLIAHAAESGVYLAVYVGQRGTRKIYVHVEETLEVEETRKVDLRSAIRTSLTEQKRYVLPLEKLDVALLEAVLDVNKAKPRAKWVVVVRDSLKSAETIESGMARTLENAERIRAQLLNAGLPAGQVTVYGIGPLAPPTTGEHQRSELLLITN